MKRCVSETGYGLWGPDWGLVDWLAANSDYILYLLMFSVGISVGMHHVLWNKLKQYHIKILVVPAGIVVGSMLGGILCETCIRDRSVPSPAWILHIRAKVWGRRRLPRRRCWSRCSLIG